MLLVNKPGQGKGRAFFCRHFGLSQSCGIVGLCSEVASSPLHTDLSSEVFAEV